MLVFPGPNFNSGFTSNRMGPGVPGPEGNPYYINILYLFTYIYTCFAASAASPAPTHTSIKESTTVGQAPKAPAQLLWRRPKALSFMDGCVGAGEAAEAAKHAYLSLYIYIYIYIYLAGAVPDTPSTFLND